MLSFLLFVVFLSTVSSREIPENSDICLLPQRLPGVEIDCEAFIPRYFYNPETKACERFIYGGCGGGENNFVTEKECNRRCTSVLSEDKHKNNG